MAADKQRKPDKECKLVYDGAKGHFKIDAADLTEFGKKHGEQAEWQFEKTDGPAVTVELADWHVKDTRIEASPFEEAPPYSVIVRANGKTSLSLTIRLPGLKPGDRIPHKYSVRTTCKKGDAVGAWQVDPDLIIEG
jgi:hypothetical protein